MKRALFVLAVLTVPVAAQDTRALPEPEAFFAAVRDTLTRGQKQQSVLAYKERRTELRTNPFGRKVGTGDGSLVYDVVPNADATVFTRTLIERDGKPLPPAEQERDRLDRRGRNQAPRSFEDVTDTLRFALDRREVVDGRSMIVIRFQPKPEAKPRTRQGRMAKIFTGEIWVDESAREVVRVVATAIDSLSMGFGMIARLNKGSTVQLMRRPVVNGIWAPTSIRFTGEGRAMMFRKLDVDYSIEWFDYREVAK
jgi:hypothetical protein